MEELNNPQISQESKDKDVAKQTAYYPASDVCIDLKTVVPVAMSFEQKDFNKKIKLIIETNYKMSVAEYVADKLRYNSIEDLCKAFAKEQIDAIATAIWNSENTGNGLIVADQTGVGKGRIGAGLIRYCILYMKKVPIFFTEKKHLINDMFRDLVDIGFDAGIVIKKRDEKKSDKDYTDNEILKMIKKEIADNDDIVSIDFDFEEGEDFSPTKSWLEDENNSEKVQELIEAYRQMLMERGEIVYERISDNDYRRELDIANKNGRILVKPFLPFAFDIIDKSGNVLYESKIGDVNGIIKSKTLPKEYKAIFLSYSQVSNPFDSNGALTDKMKFLQKYANDTLIILDESHAASGSASGSGESNTTRMVRSFITNAKMAIYISATFAKSPRNLPLYSLKTSIKESNLSYDELIDAFRKGDVPLQEAVAAELTKIGQLVRREKLIEGDVEYQRVLEGSEAEQNQINKLDRVADLFEKVRKFGDDIRAQFNASKKNHFPIKEEANKIKWGGNTNRFSFLLFNYFVLGLKIRQTCDEAVYQMSNGRKVVIAIANTLESAFDNMKKDVLNDIPYELGDMVDNDFNSYCLFLLNYCFRYTITEKQVDDSGNEIEVNVPKFIRDRKTDFEREVFDAVEEKFTTQFEYIRDKKVGVPISPIDNIKHLIQQNEGKFSVEEVTGRKRCLEFENGDLSMGILSKRKVRKVSEIVNDFNANKIDCLIINQSGAVGLSMHALPTKNTKGDIIPPVDVVTSEPPTNLRPNNEVKQRCMIVTQSELDINKEVQKLGRINRTGQVFPPLFKYLISAIPSEKRLSSLLEKKLRSLSANVTGSKDQFNDLFSSDDLFGANAVEPFNETLDKLAYPFPKAQTGNDIKDFTKILYFYSYEIQKRFYDTFTELFNKKIQELIEKGLYSNMGVVKNYDAKITATYPFIIGNNDSYSAFGSHTYLTISDCMVYETKILESNITMELNTGHNIKFGGETLLLKTKEYVEWAKSYEKRYLKFKEDEKNFSINVRNKTKEEFQKEIETKLEDAKKFEDLPKALELKERIKNAEEKVKELTEKVGILFSEGKIEEGNAVGREIQSAKKILDELRNTYDANKNYEDIILRQDEQEKIIRRIERLKEYIKDKDDEILELENQYLESVRIISLFVEYVKNIGKVFEFEKFKEGQTLNDEYEYVYEYMVMQPKQKIVLYDVKIDTNEVMDNLTLGKIHLKYFYVTGTDNFSLYQVHDLLSESEIAEGRRNPITLVNTGENYINNWNDYIATINTGRMTEKLILNGNILKAYAILSTGNNLGSIMKYTLENKKLQTGIELNKDEAERKRAEINNDKYGIYFEVNELNYEKLVIDLMTKKGERCVANQVLISKGEIFMVTEFTASYLSPENNIEENFKVHLIVEKKNYAEFFLMMFRGMGVDVSILQYTGKPLDLLGENILAANPNYKDYAIKLKRGNYEKDETIFISSLGSQQEFNQGKKILDKGIVLSISLSDFKQFILALKKEKDITLMSITSNRVVEESNFYVFQDNSSNIANVSTQTEGGANVVEPLTPEVEKTLDELVNELVDLLK